MSFNIIFQVCGTLLVVISLVDLFEMISRYTDGSTDGKPEMSDMLAAAIKAITLVGSYL